MNQQLSPARVGVATGVIAGVLLAAVVLLIGVNQVGDGLGAAMDAFSAFVIGAVLAGAIAAFIQWRRVLTQAEDAAPPGWYDSPEEDGNQWYWSGTKWTERTRATPERIKHIDSTN